MAIVVETGVGLANADSFASVADADAYFTNLGYATWTGTTSVKENALKIASVYLERVYYGRWRGVKKTSAQSLSWPRSSVVDNDGHALSADSLPQALKNATFELALRSLTETILPDLTTPGSLTAKIVKVGPVEIHKKFQGGSSPYKKYSTVDFCLLPLLEDSHVVTRA